MIEMLVASLLGATLGTIVGLTPALGVLTVISILLPFLIGASAPMVGLIFVISIYYSAQYSGSTTSILFKLPGETSSIVTCIDGHELALKGQAGRAIFIAAFSSFFAGVAAAGIIYFISPVVSILFTKLTPVETFMLTALGLYFSVTSFSSQHGTSSSISTTLFALCFGLLLSFVGINAMSGAVRFTGGVDYLYDGFKVTVLAAGLIGGAEIFPKLFIKSNHFSLSAIKISVRSSWADIKLSFNSILRGTTIGSVVGFVPGGGAIVAALLAYSIEGKITKDVGSGAIQAVASPEAANNAAAQTSLIPLLTLGIPENAVTGLIFALMLSSGIPFGPTFFADPSLLQGLVICILVGNLLALILNLPLVNLSTKLFLIPEKIMYTMIGVILLVGVYFINRDWWDVLLLLIMSVVGVLLTHVKIPTIPVVMGFVLGPILEDRFNKSLMISNGDLGVFLNSWVLQLIILSFVIWFIAKKAK